jgi:hypothetical protein
VQFGATSHPRSMAVACAGGLDLFSRGSRFKHRQDYPKLPDTVLNEVTLTSKSIFVIGRGDPYVCETLRVSHSLTNMHRDDDEVLILTYQPRSTPQ